MQNTKQYSGIIAWFAQNHVAANLLMIFFLLGGYLILGVMNREIFPTIDPKIINVTVPYPGASPEDVEEGITQRIEEAVLAVDGIKRISSVAAENMGNVMLELEEYADPNDVYNEVRDEVGRLIDFPPQNADNVIIRRVKPKSSLMQLSLSGNVSENMLHDYAERIEQDLLALPMINDVVIRGGRVREITIEISSEVLEKYNLSHNEVASAIRNASQNIPAGRLETSAGDILLRVQEKRYFADEYHNIIIRALPDGTLIRLGDIAELIDGFDDSNLRYEYNGKPSLTISITRNAKQDVIEMEDQINQYLAGLSLPQALTLDIKKNSTDPLKDRTNLMIKNALGGFVLLFICLLLFLDLKLAFWISMGVPISFMGGLMLAYFAGVGINMITLFALIVVIGVVVDDAIIIGESIFYEQENPQDNDGPYDAVIRGVKNVIAPATVGVMTTIIAFVPLLLTTGTFGQILRVIPIVVISILFLSLIEAYFILPAHLAKPNRWSNGIVKEFQVKIDQKLQNFTNNILVPLVKVTMQYRYATMTAVICFISVGAMAISSGQLRVVFFPVIEGTQVTASLEMPIETSFEETEKNAEKLLAAAHKTISYYAGNADKKVYENISFSVGQNAAEAGPGGAGSSASGNHLARIDIELVGSDDREFSGLEFERLWRNNTGQISGARSLEFQSSLIRSGDDLNIELSHKNADMLSGASEYLRANIANIEGVTTIKESLEKGKREYHFTPTDAGYAAGLTPSSLALAIRSAFNGTEVTRVQRGRSEVRVMVRLPEGERATRETLDNLRIKLPNGTRAALKDMADITIERGYSVINSTDGRRVIALLGDIDETIRTTDEVTATIEANYIPEMEKRFPGIEYSYEGKAKERKDDISSLKTNTFLAIFIIFALLAVQLKGYVAPFVIVANIPLGVIGAVYAHWILGHDLSFMSVFGIVALCGVVVNDSVVLIDYYNRMREQGMSEFDALAASAKRRFRAILLTTLTNGFSTLPILLETSVQAQFLIPMAISLSCGIFFSTALLFVFTPSLMHIIKDIEDVFQRFKRKIQEQLV